MRAHRIDERTGDARRGFRLLGEAIAQPFGQQGRGLGHACGLRTAGGGVN